MQKKLSKFDLDIQDFITPEVAALEYAAKGKKKTKTKDAPKALFVVENEKDNHEFYSLQKVLGYVKDQASKGIHIQRYKGLGEMNPQQLWETTMDPAKRTILRVELEDGVEADKTFTTLMGDEVEPRREFIETYAHEVKNLDI